MRASIRGRLDRRLCPRVQVTLIGPAGHVSRSAIVDTGFTGAISIPSDLVSRLGLRFAGTRPAQSADGKTRTVRLFEVSVRWHHGDASFAGWESAVEDILIGAELLRGHRLVVDYGPSRSVEIR